MNNFNLLKTIWHDVYNPNKDTAIAITTYFHPNYEQCINGVKLNRPQYIEHVIEQKKNIIINHFNYQHTLENANELFAIYDVNANNIHNQPVEVEVIAYFLFEAKQLLKAHGQVRLIKGNLSDVDMK